MNPFPEGQEVVEQARKIAKYFSYGARLKLLRDACVKAGVRPIKPRLDVNGTRIGAKFNLVHSIITLEKGLRQFDIDHPKTISIPSRRTWDGLREIEAVLSITQQLCLFAQTEKYFMAAMGPQILAAVHEGLFADCIEVIDTGSITQNKSDLRRECVDEDDLTEVGMMCLERARLEFQRRYCKNETESIDSTGGSRICITKAAAIAVMLDLRTCNTAGDKLKQFDFGATQLELGSLLKDEYVELWVAAKRKSFAAAGGPPAEAAAEADGLAAEPPSRFIDEFGIEVVVPSRPCLPELVVPSDEQLKEGAEESESGWPRNARGNP